jgi:hypothetical protein
MNKSGVCITFLFFLATMAIGQVPNNTSAPTTPVRVSPEELPILRGEIDIRKMATEHRDFRQKAVRRIMEIDRIIEPVMAKTATELFRITTEEYEFLRLQAQSKNSAQVLTKTLKGIDYDEVLQKLDYFDAAYAALQSGQYWIGQEQDLIPKDAELYQAMQVEIEKALSKTEDGRRTLALVVEREELVTQLQQPKPILEYFIERRRWWDAFPEYKKNLKKTKEEEILQHLND